ncbi:MAG: hypothetical protein ABIJ46_00640 [bacterium]
MANFRTDLFFGGNVESLKMTGSQLLLALQAVLYSEIRCRYPSLSPRFSEEKLRDVASRLSWGKLKYHSDMQLVFDVGVARTLIGMLQQNQRLAGEELEVSGMVDILTQAIRGASVLDDHSEWQLRVDLLKTFFAAVASGEITEADLV